MKLGVLSDTHDHLSSRIPELFRGVDHIIHAGDIGRAWILLQLEQIAPVTAVLGNTDQFLPLSETAIFQQKARKFLVHHIVEPYHLQGSLPDLIRRERPDVVIFGHTHKRFCGVVDGTLFFNPGYAGNKTESVRSVAILHCDEKEIRPEFLPL